MVVGTDWTLCVGVFGKTLRVERSQVEITFLSSAIDVFERATKCAPIEMEKRPAGDVSVLLSNPPGSSQEAERSQSKVCLMVWNEFGDPCSFRLITRRRFIYTSDTETR